VKTKTIFFALCAVCASAVFSISTAFAQSPTVYHPGDSLSFTVKFDGDGVEKLTAAQVSLALSSPVREDQKAFLTSINLNSGGATRPGVFDASGKIPDFVASGTYTLRQVSTGTQFVGFLYRSDLPTITIAVENNQHFTQPQLKSVEKTSTQ
jgi:hypothetical protein